MKLKNYFLILGVLFSNVVFPQTGTTISRYYTIGSDLRTYTFYVPAMYSGTTAVPLVFNLHGLSGNSTKQETYEDFRTIADTANFIVVHPEGLNQSPIPQFSLPGWGSMTTVAADAADMAFIMSLLDTMKSRYNIDANRVYSAGYSQGGFLSYNLACQQNAKFAAIASSSGSLSLNNMAASSLVHPTPVMEIHGTTDNTISYAGNATYLGVDALIQHWVCANNCSTTPVIDSLPDISTSDNCRPVHYVYNGGTGGSTVELYKIIGGGHQVPSDVVTANEYGIGNRNRDFKASKVIWEFFRKYSLSNLTGNPSNSCTATSTGVEDVVLNNGVSIYPNPSNGIFTVEIRNNLKSTIKIVNSLGETILEEKVPDNWVTFDISGSAPGVYSYQIINQAGILSNGKLMIK